MGTKVLTTDLIGQPYGVLKVIGGKAEVREKVFGGAEFAELTAFVSDGNHIPVEVRTNTIALIAKEEEAEVLSPEELEAQRQAAGFDFPGFRVAEAG